MFIVVINYKKPIEEIEKQLVAHRSFLEEGYQKNYFIASGPRNPRTGGIVLSQLKDRAQLESIMQQDPFQLHDLADYAYIEFEPVKYHVDFKQFIQ